MNASLCSQSPVLQSPLAVSSWFLYLTKRVCMCGNDAGAHTSKCSGYKTISFMCLYMTLAYIYLCVNECGSPWRACLFRGLMYCLWASYVSTALFRPPTGNTAPMCRETFWHRTTGRKQAWRPWGALARKKKWVIFKKSWKTSQPGVWVWWRWGTAKSGRTNAASTDWSTEEPTTLLCVC